MGRTDEEDVVEGDGEEIRAMRKHKAGIVEAEGHEEDEVQDSGGARASTDGLSQEMAAEERQDHGRQEEGEEGREPRGLHAPHQVSKAERELHELTHTPYRAWCRYCVRARGRNMPHRTRDEERKAGGVPKIAMDYFFVSKADEQASKNPLIVMVDESTGEKYARAVGQKGLGRETSEMDWLIKDMSEELRAWGHPGGEAGHIILKSDGETSIKAVREALAKYHGGKVIPESPPRGESASNGTAEEAGKTVREFVRVLKEQVEHRANIKLDCAEVLTVWMVRWAAMLCSRHLVGKDGLTAYERRKGKRCQIPLVPFGEKVWYKELRASKERKEKFESEWREGVWLGHSRESNEAVIGTKDGAVRAYAIKRQDEDRRWDGELLKDLQGTPQQPDPGKPGLAIPIRIHFDPPSLQEPIRAEENEKPRQIRRMKITARMLEKYGYSDGCDGCRYRRAGLGESRNHTEECRKRIEAEMDRDEDGRKRKEEDEARINHRIAEEMERTLGTADAGEDRGTAGPSSSDSVGSGGAAERPSRNVATDDGAPGKRTMGNPADEPMNSSDARRPEQQGRENGAAEMIDSAEPGPQQSAPPGERGGGVSGQIPREAVETPTTPGGERHRDRIGARENDYQRSRARTRSPRTRTRVIEADLESDRQRPKRNADEEQEEHGAKRRKEEDSQAGMEIDSADQEETPIIQELKRVSVDIAEMYSPRGVTDEAKNFGLTAGEAMDLTTGWDFTKEENRSRAMKYIEVNKPKLIIGSPMCTMFSQLQRMTGWSAEKQRRWTEDRRHLKFMAQVYRNQVLQGRWFLHEHPATASSWSLKEITDLLDMQSVEVVQADQCMYGLKTWGQNGKDVLRARKRTQFMSNSPEIRRQLSRQCDGWHQHQALTGGRAQDSARYPKELCRSICMGLMLELRNSQCKLMRLVDVGPDTKMQEHAPEEDDDAWKRAWDDMTGEELDAKEVTKARLKEMKYVHEKGVWKVIPRAEARRQGWKVIGTRWIDINKGDKENPNHRSRLVAKEFNDGVHHDGLFAATPPLEALRLLISETATIRDGAGSSEKVIMINDVARAFFEAPVRRTVCVELPAEAIGQGDGSEEMVGLLKMSLYGTRDAAANFQEEVRKVMVGLGFTQSKYSPSVYWHQARGLKTLVHGDDFITSGSREDAKWFKEGLEKRFEIKTKVVGGEKGEAKEERVLNRIVRVTADGWEYEADQRHSELIIKGMNLCEAKGVKGPGEDEKPWEAAENEMPIAPKEAASFRALAARANYLAQDRADIQYAAKEVCRGMAQPTKGDVKKLRRLARYLIEVPRVVWSFRYQGNCDQVQAYSDSDWAGCKRTARSTTGGAIVRGSHCIRTWSSTQKFVTLSSAEAELMAAVRATAEAIGIVQLAESWGVAAQASILVDSSAALAVVSRKGNGKLRHVKVGHLWIQEKASSGDVVYRKVRGECNPADLMTKYLPASKVLEFSDTLQQIRTAGHASARLALSPFTVLAEGPTSVADHSRTRVGGSGLDATVSHQAEEECKTCTHGDHTRSRLCVLEQNAERSRSCL